MWDIDVSLADNPYPLRLCRCTTPEIVSAIVLALCRAQEARPITIKRVEAEPTPDPPGYDAFKGGA